MKTQLLAKSSVGQVFTCEKCGNIHLSCGNFSTSFSPEAFRELERMVSQAEVSLADRSSAEILSVY